MKRDLTISLIVLLILSGIRLFAQDAIIQENRPVTSFSGIKVSGIAKVYLKKSDTEKVDIEVNNKEYNDRLIVEVVDHTLIIRTQQDGKFNHNNVDLKVYINYKNLNRIQASGITHIYANNVISADKMELATSGVSTVNLDIKAGELDIESSGTSNITLAGSAATLSTKTWGVSNIRAYNLAAQQVTSQSSGASNIYVSASKSISAKASGASNINYKGDPQVTNRGTSGAASIRRM